MPVPTYDCEEVAATSLRKTMVGIPAIVAIVEANKIQWMGIERDDVPMPFISIEYINGGWEKDEFSANSADLIMKVCLTTSDKLLAAQARAAIAKLHRAEMVVTDFTGVVPTDKLFMVLPLRETDKAQNIPVYNVGGYFQLRFVVN